MQPPEGWPEVRELADPFLGRVIDGRYRVTKPIGRGASGQVYRAESLTIPRNFAIKFISIPGKPGSARAEQARVRIRRETSATLELRNPHVINVYDVIDLNPHVVAIVMEFIEGKTLEALVLDANGLGTRRVIKLARQMANGLFEAHEAGLIHRDVKPENFMVERMPAGDDFVHVLDFGIVWARGSAHVTEGFIGTPLYASPDQVEGSELDERSDIYSLGASIFFMLAARPPFASGSPMKILHDHVKSEPPKLLEICEPQPGLNEIASLVEHMMAKSPDKRPANLAAVISELDRIEREVFLSNPSPTRRLEPTDCGSCRSIRVTHHEGRSESDVPCMTQVELGYEPDHLAFSQEHFALVANDELRWGSLATSGLSAHRIDAPHVSALALTASSILYGTEDGMIFEISDVESEPQVVERIPGPVLALSTDGARRTLLALTPSGVFVNHGSDTELLERSSGATTCTVSPSGAQFAVGYEDGSIRIWQVVEHQESDFLKSSDAPIERLAFSRDDYLLAALAAGEVILEAPMTKSRIYAAREFVAPPRVLTFSKSDNLMAVAFIEGRLVVLDLQCRMISSCHPESKACHVV